MEARQRPRVSGQVLGEARVVGRPARGARRAAGGAAASSRGRAGRARRWRSSVTVASWYAEATAATTVSLVQMELLTNPETWIALATLTRPRDRPRHRQRHLHLDPRPAAAREPARPRPADRPRASRWACGSLLLLTISWIIGLTQPLVTPVRSGLLVARPDPDRRRPVPALEGHDRDPRVARGRARPPRRRPRRATASFGGVLVQIVLLDIVFSLDSVLTAVGHGRRGRDHDRGRRHRGRRDARRVRAAVDASSTTTRRSRCSPCRSCC